MSGVLHLDLKLTRLVESTSLTRPVDVEGPPDSTEDSDEAELEEERHKLNEELWGTKAVLSKRVSPEQSLSSVSAPETKPWQSSEKDEKHNLETGTNPEERHLSLSHKGLDGNCKNLEFGN
ncbi:hypothetical protein NDU88_002074 [Pleurodeles waltl]|uniref:Uncharacterized protein n=1 Tax=Pleurodeles waltl TaxID=8319 RepID=A0AAV7U9X7_PLEWA|nr:hypothetical protein NDU88_002074 [Pleurodeles waltl]